MPIATVCPHCQSTFRTPVDALRRADGSVRCGECTCVFVGLKHALLFDSPIVERLESPTVEFRKKKNWSRSIAAVVGVFLISIGVFVSHVGLTKNAFSLDYAHAVAPAYKIAGVQMPLYQGIDAFVLGQSTLLKNEDQSIRLSFGIYNRAGVPVAWPKLRVVLVGAQGQTTYDVVTNVGELLPTKPAGPVPPLANFELEAQISAEKAKDAVSYKLEVVE